MYDVMDIAKYVVTKCTREQHPISNLQLQKILYYIQKVFLKKRQKAFDADIEAWRFGPVVSDVYYYFCGYGAMPISSEYTHKPIADNDRQVIDKIVCEKRDLPPWDLVEETHRKNGAWDRTFKNQPKGVIAPELIRTVG